MRIELLKPIPVHTRILLRADGINVGGSATVKHVSRRGAKCIVGLNLSQALRDEILTAIRERDLSGCA
jgi:hypothetical protein